MKLLKTNKLFYNKWPVKVECYLKGSSKFVRYGPEYTLDWCAGKERDFGYGIDRDVNRAELSKFTLKVISVLEGKDVKIRSEGSHFNIFCADTNTLDTIKKEMAPWIQTITEPESDAEREFLLSSGPKKVLCKEYPHGKFKYKVYIRDRLDVDTRKKFIDWLKKYPDNTNVANNTEQWLLGKKLYIQDPFFYVIDEKMLSMVLLYLGNYCKKTHQYILKSSINTSCPH
jgi:hypothetical protein